MSLHAVDHRFKTFTMTFLRHSAGGRTAILTGCILRSHYSHLERLRLSIKLLITNKMSGCVVTTSCYLPSHSHTTPSFLILLAQDVGRHGVPLPKGPVETVR
uniref:Uncharacterized protein n=1 Tax=Hyaloperonospora arabidopsidis (strain Emoy2) TaxID=559515 RepID=M4BG76_HYAAE